jgi:hypothetical protein
VPPANDPKWFSALGSFFVRVQPRRIHIVGGPGSGKTTLAMRLGGVLDVPAHDLDLVAYERGTGRRRDSQQRRAMAERIAETSGWVVEGIYLAWCEPLAERADLVVWLDVPWRTAAYRIVRRHIRLSLAGTNPHPGLRRLGWFVLAARRYYLSLDAASPVEDDDGAITRLGTRLWLRQYGDKVTRCRTARDVDALVAAAAGRTG